VFACPVKERGDVWSEKGSGGGVEGEGSDDI